MLRVVSVVALTLLTVGLFMAPTQAQPSGLSFQDALNLALKANPTGQLLMARSENKSVGAVYGFYFMMPNFRIREYEIRYNGRVAKDEEVSGEFGQDLLDAINARKGAKIPFTRFMELASTQVKGGDLKRIEVKLGGGKINVQMDMEAGKETKRVEIDVADGKVTKVSTVSKPR